MMGEFPRRMGIKMKMEVRWDNKGTDAGSDWN